MSIEHPIKQKIIAAIISPDGPNDAQTLPWRRAFRVWVVGCLGVTRIESTTKSGMHADIPYIRVWKGDVAAAEYCQHNIIGIEFATEQS